ncbi:PLDc N-terminal domain-containing protein [Agrococcus lahaulensis]|uniref:PLDc N-terminal domain-containing protein n=1 Tax=Agrococcus lahaulensis TaxID=341722 RepID=UPI000688E11E|nr:PLDc N-terminal domain-containing protein [Agrococcus lahaulensis]
MLAAVNPLLPAGYDVIWTISLLAIATLAVVAMGQLVRAKAVAGVEAAIWVLIILALPVVGPIAWLAVRPDSREERALRG